MLGREDECAALDRVLDKARRGESTALLIEGEAGVGKTSLCDYVAERVLDLRVIRALGIESESWVAFAGLSQLLAPVVRFLDQLPEPQRHALAGALALEEAVPTAPLTLGLATLSVLAAAADERPVLAIIDDTHWFDPSSAEALAFAARRLAHESVAIVLAQRPSEAHSLASDGFSVLGLEGLDPAAARALLEQSVGTSVADGVAAELVDATRGNPMALIEVASTLSPSMLAGLEPLRDPLLFAGDVAAAETHRIAALPERTRDALVVVAADATGSLAAVEPALEIRGIHLAALELAEAASIVHLDGSTATFRHPLLRSAVYSIATATERRAAHQALADAATAAGDSERAAWHLAAATPGPDESIAARLQQVAIDAQVVGGAAAAAPAWDRVVLPPGRRDPRRPAGGRGECAVPRRPSGRRHRAARRSSAPDRRSVHPGRRDSCACAGHVGIRRQRAGGGAHPTRGPGDGDP